MCSCARVRSDGAPGVRRPCRRRAGLLRQQLAGRSTTEQGAATSRTPGTPGEEPGQHRRLPRQPREGRCRAAHARLGGSAALSPPPRCCSSAPARWVPPTICWILRGGLFRGSPRLRGMLTEPLPSPDQPATFALVSRMERWSGGVLSRSAFQFTEDQRRHVAGPQLEGCRPVLPSPASVGASGRSGADGYQVPLRVTSTSAKPFSLKHREHARLGAAPGVPPAK